MTVQAQMESAYDFLGKTIGQLEFFINDVTLSSMLEEEKGDKGYYKSILSSLRRLLVYCEEGYEATSIVLNGSPFSKAAAEHALYRIYHKCIEEFYSPRSDAWFEDSRASYSGTDAIHFRSAVPGSVKTLIRQLEPSFEHVRTELAYYESEFRARSSTS